MVQQKLCFLNHSEKIHEDRYKKKGKLLISHIQSAAENLHLTNVKSQLTFCWLWNFKFSQVTWNKRSYRENSNIWYVNVIDSFWDENFGFLDCRDSWNWGKISFLIFSISLPLIYMSSVQGRHRRWRVSFAVWKQTTASSTS